MSRAEYAACTGCEYGGVEEDVVSVPSVDVALWSVCRYVRSGSVWDFEGSGAAETYYGRELGTDNLFCPDVPHDCTYAIYFKISFCIDSKHVVVLECFLDSEH